MAEVKSAQITISEHWDDHVHCKTVSKAPRWDTEQGVICACGEVLGWPDPENRETLSQYSKRVVSERVDAASAPGRVKGAFGTYGRPAPVPEDGEPARALPGGDNAPEPGDYPEPEQQEPSAPVPTDDPGPDEPDDDVDWGEPPVDEPEPEYLPVSNDAWNDPAVHQARRATGVHDMREVELPTVIEDGDSEDVGTAPFPADAVPDERGNLISGGMSYGPADEAQAESDLPPWNDPPKYEEGPTAEELASIVAGPPGGLQPPEPEIGRDQVPYAGTPIMPSEGQKLDPLSGRLAPLDPTLPYTPADVELKIVEILRQLENSELFLRQQLARLHQATHNHDFRYNLALAKSDQRAADQRKAEGWLATEKERHEMTEAEMLVRALRDSQHNLRAQLSGFQSVARSIAVSLTNALDGRDKPSRVTSDRLPPEPRAWDR